MTVKINIKLIQILAVASFLCIVQTHSFAQGWEKLYSADGTLFNNYVQCISPTTDGGAIILTSERDLQQPGFEFLKLIKVDQDGIVQKQTVLNDPIFYIQYLVIEPTTDGKLLAAVQSESDSLYLFKFDQNGVMDWNRALYNSSDYVSDTRINNTLDGGYLITTQEEIALHPTFPRVIKLTSSGSVQWDFIYNYPLYFVYKPLPVTINPNHTYSLIFYEEEGSATTVYTKVMLLDSVGQILSVKTISGPGQEWRIVDAVKSNSAGMRLLVQNWLSNEMLFVKTDSIGNHTAVDTLISFPQGLNGYGETLYHTIDGGLLFTSNLADQNNNVFTFVVKLDSNDNIEWEKTIPSFFLFNRVSPLGEYYFISQTLSNDIRVVKLDKYGVLYGSFITGNVIHDLNQDCLENMNESRFKNWLVEAQNNTDAYYGFTDTLGNYFIELDTGNYNLDVITPSSLWNTCTINPIQINSNDTINQDLLVNSLYNCPYLTVDVSVPFLRRCFNNTYTVSYCNRGTIASPTNTIELNFHPHFDVISSSIPWSSQSGNTYTFSVGNLDIESCGWFTMTVVPNCDSTILGQTLCVDANISPDTICTPPSPSWDGSITDLEVHCGSDSLTFIIKNIGLGDMAAPLEYFVIEDNFITKQSLFQLVSLDTMQLKFPANGSTYRLYAGQSPGRFPDNYTPTIAYEGCGNNANGTYSTGFVNLFPESELNTETIECQEIIGAFDPNDKQATPVGYGNEHYIEAGVDLHYRIRFQNTGTDTAFTVVVRDSISEHLDLGSLIQDGSSHPYQLEVINGNELKFTFNNILLPDSTTNEPGSHGFVKFKISQQPNLPLGTRIFNSAAIYFDFNEPIITNETWHEIGEDFIPVTVTSVDPVPEHPEMTIRVQPNPFVHYVEFILEEAPSGNKTFELYNAMGQLLRQEAFSGDNNHQFYKKQLSEGIYFYKILNDNNLLASGKLIAGQ